MNRRTAGKPKRSKTTGSGQPLFRGFCLIDPRIPLDHQDFTVFTESCSNAEYNEIRWELERPISHVVVEFFHSHCYGNIESIIQSIGSSTESAVRLVLTMELYAERPQSNALISDMIGLLVRFATPIPDGSAYTRPVYSARDYRLEVSLGYRLGNTLQILPCADDHPRVTPKPIEIIDSRHEETVVPISGIFYTGDEHSASQNESAVMAREGLRDDQGPEKNHSNRDEYLKSLFTGLSDDPKSLLNEVVALQRAFRQEAARILQPAVNKLLKSPPRSFVEKQNLASELNDAFHELGVAAREPDLAKPCSIVPINSQTVETGWLKLQTRQAPRQRSRPSTELGQIELIEAVRRESFGRSK